MSVRNILANLGHRPIDAGEWWRCQALYRDGGSGVSLAVHKRTGKFIDHVSKASGNLKDLIELTTKEQIEDFEEYLESFEMGVEELEEDRPRIMRERIWGEEELDKVFPHYKFYEDRGISKKTLKGFKSGMQHTGTLNRRYVFPIFNSSGCIHGWTGRDMTSTRDVKWYHVGPTKSWIYPYYVEIGGSFPCKEAIDKEGYVILVESVGDMLALHEKGYKNVLVTFGTNLSKKMCAHILAMRVKVVISTNNDLGKAENWGAKAAVDIFIKLLSYVDYEKIVIALPVGANDFGDEGHDFEAWKKKVDNPNKEEMHKYILKKLREKFKEKKLSPTIVRFAQAIKDEYDEEYK